MIGRHRLGIERELRIFGGAAHRRWMPQGGGKLKRRLGALWSNVAPAPG
jgi:hypothetical protein